MSEEAALLAELHGPRLPEIGVADLAIAAALGLLLAALAVRGAAALLAARGGPRRRFAARLEAARALPEAECAVALARIVREAGGGLPDGAAAALYRPGPGPDVAALDRAAAEAVARSPHA